MYKQRGKVWLKSVHYFSQKKRTKHASISDRHIDIIYITGGVDFSGVLLENTWHIYTYFSNIPTNSYLFMDVQ